MTPASPAVPPAAAPPVTLRPAGPFALLAELDGVVAAQALYADVAAWRASGELAGLVDVVPAARTVLAVAHPTEVGRACLTRFAAAVRDWSPRAADPQDGRLVELAVHYDGPDLADLADLLGLDVAAVVGLHAGAQYRVAFCGFAPGFGYLTGAPGRLHAPRLATPRTRVPAGAVGLAGEFCGVYPRESPGGWRLIGHTDAILWDTGREPAALLTPGTRVRWRRVP